MPASGNFGAVTLSDGRLTAIGNSVEIGGYETASLSIAIVQGASLAHGLAETSGGSWSTGTPISGDGMKPGDALGLASQTLVNVAEGTPPSFLTLTWSDQVVIAAK
jgi:hypothetical protein